MIDEVIHPSQSAFAHGRLITDNAIAAFESFYTLNMGARECDQHLALKLDMSNVFDRVEWVSWRWSCLR